MVKNKTDIIAEAGKQELFIIRTFNAPRELVFRTFSEPQLAAEWLVPAALGRRIDEMDYRRGGAWRFMMPDGRGGETSIFGVVHEVFAPERISRTFEFEGLPEKGHVALEKTTFESLAGNYTKVTIQYVCESVQFRDGLVMSGMGPTYEGLFEKLDNLLINN